MRKIFKMLILLSTTTITCQEAENLDSLENKYVELALTHNYSLKNASLKIKSAHKDVQLAKNTWGEQVVAQYNVNEANLNPSATTGTNAANSFYPRYLLGIRWSLSTFLHTPLTVNKAKIEEKIIQNDMEQEKQNMIYEVKRRFRIYVAKKENLSLRKQLTDEAKSQLNVITKKYNNKEVLFDEYLRISNTYLTLKESLNISESEMYVSKYDLEELLGVAIDNIK